MFRRANWGLWAGAVVLLSIVGCATAPLDQGQPDIAPDELGVPAVVEAAPAPPSKAPTRQAKTPAKDLSTVRRAITEKELRQLEKKDPALEFYRCLEILCRLNRKDKEYIREDMKLKRPITVPKNFSSYKDWSPLPSDIAGAGKSRKLILVVKDIHFLGWYQYGKRIGDTYVCTGKMSNWTKGGMYRVQGKDPTHMSTYPNAYGEAAYMPDALHVYDRVWIHAGDVTGPNCSHGCINVPIAYSGKLYDWAEVGTSVLITESLKDLSRDMKKSTKQ
jgi:lipoprotein-anchoring transpeptidase ErfK/SrfK